MNTQSNILEITKVCTKCGKDKPLSCYRADKRKDGRLMAACKICRDISSKSWAENNKKKEKSTPEFIKCRGCLETKKGSEFNNSKINATGKKTRCKNCDHAYVKAWPDSGENRKKIYIGQASSLMLRTYGITPEVKEAMIIAQGNCCAICKIHLDKSRRSLVGDIDHNHKTGKLRGILCSLCNSAIGQLRESEEILISAISYLSKYRCE